MADISRRDIRDKWQGKLTESTIRLAEELCYHTYSVNRWQGVPPVLFIIGCLSIGTVVVYAMRLNLKSWFMLLGIGGLAIILSIYTGDGSKNKETKAKEVKKMLINRVNAEFAYSPKADLKEEFLKYMHDKGINLYY